LAPLHFALIQQTLVQWHRIQKLPLTRLTRAVINAWPSHPWTENAHNLLAKLDIAPDQALLLSKAAFKTQLRDKLAELTVAAWEPTQQTGVARRYTDAFGAADVLSVSEAASDLVVLGDLGLGQHAQLCAKLRMETLPLRGMGRARRDGETVAAAARRRLCPCCQQGPETPAHFMFDCSQYAARRDVMLQGLQQLFPAKMAALQAIDPDVRWRSMLNPMFWDLDTAAMRLVACYVGPAMHIRSSVLQQD
jgi:hypothetical protein